jgi:hypothetical protein
MYPKTWTRLLCTLSLKAGSCRDHTEKFSFFYLVLVAIAALINLSMIPSSSVVELPKEECWYKALFLGLNFKELELQPCAHNVNSQHSSRNSQECHFWNMQGAQPHSIFSSASKWAKKALIGTGTKFL